MKITNTQYLKKGDYTNFGKVTNIWDNKTFQTDDQFTWNVLLREVIKYKTCKDCSNKVSDESQHLCEDCRSMAYYI